jgi:hypothetical protein
MATVPVKAHADSLGQVDESNEANNSRELGSIVC